MAGSFRRREKSVQPALKPPDDGPRPFLPRPIVVRLRRPQPVLRRPFKVLGFYLCSAAGAVWLGQAAVAGRLPPSVPLWLWIGLGGLLGGVFALIMGRRMRVPESVPPIRLEGSTLSLPLGVASAEAETVPLTEIESVELLAQGRVPRLVIGTARGAFVYALADFEDPRDAALLIQNVITRIALLPDGAERAQAMERRHVVAQRIRVRPPRATLTLLALIIAGYVVQHAMGAFDGPVAARSAVMLRLGANAAALVGEGQWWRLFTANFLHGGHLHIFLNGLALLSLGSVLEKLIGTSRFILVYLASAAAGALASAWAAQGPFSVGASTAIFGLLGAFAVISFRFGSQLPAGIRQSRRWWTFILGINAALPLLAPALGDGAVATVLSQIDVAAHFGGFVAGLAVAFLAYPSLKYFDPWARPSLGILGAALGLSLVFFGAAIETTQWATSSDAEVVAAVRSTLRDSRNPQALNMYAWGIVAEEDHPTDDELRLAQKWATRALTIDPDDGDLRDTLATAAYRLSDLDTAAEEERRALLAQDRPFLWSQLRRFLEARDAPWGTGAVATASVSITFADGALVVDRPDETPLVAFVAVRSKSLPLGLVRLGLPSATEVPARFAVEPPLLGFLEGGAELVPLWLDSRAEGPRPGETGLTFRGHDPDVDKLP